MEGIEYQLVERVQDTHWFFEARKAAMSSVLKAATLPHLPLVGDAGSGPGANIEFLRRLGNVVALEPNEFARTTLTRNWRGKIEVVEWNCPQPLPYEFDLLLLADVLEHLENEEEAKNWIWDHLKPGGYALITVPAFQTLWTEMDEVAHHFRRYSRGSLARLFGGKFEIVRVSYYNMCLLPAKILFVLYATLLRRLKPQSPKRSYNETPPFPFNLVAKWISGIEGYLLRYGSLPIGASLILLVRKKT